MALEMRPSCERCGAELRAAGETLVCSFECTFCPEGAAELAHVCPSGGELVARPNRASA